MQPIDYLLISFQMSKACSHLFLDRNCSFLFMTVLLLLSYIRIIHCPTLDHWVTDEICVDEQVRIFDSALTKPSFEVKKQIATIIPTKQNKIDFKLEKTQQ